MDDNQRFSAGLLNEVAQELVSLVLDTDVVRLLERLEQARQDIRERDMELSRRGEVIMELTSKVSTNTSSFDSPNQPFRTPLVSHLDLYYFY